MFVQFFLSLLIAVLSTANAQGQRVTNAICRIQNGTVNGQLNLTSYDAYGIVTVKGLIQGLYPGYHGFHVHQYGDLSKGCEAAGPHYNPFGNHHGAPTDADRHVGDLGNVVANYYGFAWIDISDYEIKLSGPFSILGRAIVVHAYRDDLGRGGNEESLKTGNSGPRVGCCVIAVSPKP